MVCRMAKRKMKKRRMICRLMILGMELNSDVIAIFRPRFLEMILKGLRILRILTALMPDSWSLFSPEPKRPRRAAKTMMKSRTFQALRM